MQGIGDSSQGFANAILFIIFTKNIRESFFECFRCRMGQDNEDPMNCGQIQTPSTPTSRLNRLSSNSQIEKKPIAESDSEVSQCEKEEVSLLFDSLVLSQTYKPEQSDHFQRYGAVSWFFSHQHAVYLTIYWWCCSAVWFECTVLYWDTHIYSLIHVTGGVMWHALIHSKPCIYCGLLMWPRGIICTVIIVLTYFYVKSPPIKLFVLCCISCVWTMW